MLVQNHFSASEIDVFLNSDINIHIIWPNPVYIQLQFSTPTSTPTPELELELEFKLIYFELDFEMNYFEFRIWKIIHRERLNIFNIEWSL